MTEDEFYAFLDDAVFSLERKQAQLQAEYSMGSQARWWFDQQAGVLKFYDDPKKAIDLEADVVVIGTYDPEASTWKWGWANTTLSEAMRDATAPVKALAETTSVDDFAEAEEFAIEPGMAWEFAAMAVAELGLMGVYRAPSALGKHHTFLGIAQVKPKQATAG